MNSCPKIKRTVYEEASPTPIINFMKESDRVYRFFSKKFNYSPAIISISGDRRTEFKDLWGEQSCTWNGEYRFYIWLHPLPNCNLFVLSASQYGTAYEVEVTGNKEKALDETLDFLNHLIAILGRKE